MGDNRLNSEDNSRNSSVLHPAIPEAASLVKVSVVIPFHENPGLNKTNDSLFKPIRVKSKKEKLLTFHSEEMRTSLNSKSCFLLKLYGSFFLQFSIVLVFCLICSLVDEMNEWMKKQYLGFVISITACFLILLLVLTFHRRAKIEPFNYLIFLLLTICFSFLFGYLEAVYDDLSTVSFLVMFDVVSFSHPCFIYIKGSEINIRSHWKLVLSSSIAGFGAALVFTYKIYFKTIIALTAIVFFFFFSMYDSHVISGGRFDEFTYDDYLISSQLIYIDVVGISYYLIASAFE
jgi:FtsH-binding integral membrane protein